MKFIKPRLLGFNVVPMSYIKPGHASGRDAVFWSDRMNEYLIDSLLHQQSIGNRGEAKFFSAAYDSIVTGVGERFGVAIDRNNIKNRLKYIKETFYECKSVLGEDTRIKWCPESRRFNADPNVWRELIQVLVLSVSQEYMLTSLLEKEIC